VSSEAPINTLECCLKDQLSASDSPSVILVVSGSNRGRFSRGRHVIGRTSSGRLEPFSAAGAVGCGFGVPVGGGRSFSAALAMLESICSEFLGLVAASPVWDIGKFYLDILRTAFSPRLEKGCSQIHYHV
jgi:hypothetical protein